LCQQVADAVQESNASSRDLGIVIDASCLEPPEAWKIRCANLGPGPLYLRMGRHVVANGFWQQLWHQRSNTMLRLAYSSFVLSQTCLLPYENAAGIASDPGLQVPTGSSWITVDVDVTAYADDHGVLDEKRFEAMLQEAVIRGDQVHGRTAWPTAQMRHDAWLNRRLAINLVGIGALVKSRKHDPGDFSTLDRMSDLVLRARQALLAATKSLAARDGNVPALEQADPGRQLPGGNMGNSWTRRWRNALEEAAVRNRNLLAISPWSIFPPGRADIRYANLLPLLRIADVCSFGAPPDVSFWNLNNFKSFHQQAAAVLQQRGAAHQIAVHA
jgi:hypothetical protein